MWVSVAKATEMAPETARVVRVAGLELALVQTTAGLFAMDNTCPHSGGPLGEGLVQGNTVTCPLHGWQFDCKSGKCLTEKRPAQKRYAVTIEKDQILVEVPDVPAMPAEGKKPTTSEWTVVASVSDLAPGNVRKVQAGGMTLALVCTGEGLHAVDNLCPHEGGSIGEGSVEEGTVSCPLHNYKFDCKTGKCVTDARLRVPVYETKIEHSKIWVRVAATPPIAASANTPEDPAKKKSAAEIWKTIKHGIDCWDDILRFARENTPMSRLEEPELERMKWYGYFYRKNNDLDHYMVRIRIPGCEMTSEQARTIAFVAYESGYSIVDVTTRGNMQVQGLTIDKLPGIRAVLEKVGLTSRQSGHDNIRNITSHPFSGIDPEELIDTHELARQIQGMIVGSREFSDLPRKFNIALTGRTDPQGHAWTQDISYVAAWGPEGRVGFQFLIGGNQGQSPKIAWHIPVFIPPEQALDVTAATLRTFRELGYRHNRHQVRFRFLIDRLGPDQVLLEIEKRLGYSLQRFPKSPPKPSGEENFIGWFPQKQQGLWAVGICVPVGRLTWDQFEGLAVIAQQYGSGTLRTTYDQNLIIPGIPAAQRQAVGYAIARYGLTFEPDPVTRNMVACTGKQFCNLAVTETKGYAYQLIETLRHRKVQLHGINIHMSGCPSSCATSYTADIGLKGMRVRRDLRVLDAFNIYLGGGLSDDVQMGILYKTLIPVGELPDELEKVVRDFYLHRRDGETFSKYWRNKLKGHKALPAKEALPKWQCSRCGHLHVAQDPPPFCPLCAALRATFVPAPEGGESQSTGPAVTQAAVPVNGSPTPKPVGPPIWVCTSCGQKHVGEEPPDLCLVCGVTKKDFQLRGAGTVLVAKKPSGKRILIIGGSIGGHTAAHTARRLDQDAQITLITEDQYSFYNRLSLTRFLSEEVERVELFDYKPEWYEDNQIEVLTNTRVIGLNAAERMATLSEGRELAYDACILTHGSSANAPPFYRADLPGVYLLRTLDDVEGIIACIHPGTKVAVIGGGVLGLEAAYGILKRGGSVQVFELFPHLMPRQLDQAAAALFTEMVKEKGIEPYVGVSVKEILGKESAEGLTLADGRGFAADLIVVSTGIKPNIHWVKRSGIRCNRGVLVDDRLQTSADSVYAAGDVVEWRGQVIGLWTNAIEQAKVAATNAIGKISFFQGFLPVTILKCLGIQLVSIGEIEEVGDNITSKLKYDSKARTYRRVVYRNGLPIGGILLGTSSGMGDMRKLIENGLELEKLTRKVVPDEALQAA
jgi:ferredoxin-nitrite reductase